MIFIFVFSVLQFLETNMENEQSISSKCDFCDKSFHNEDSLSMHIVSLHKSIIEGQKTPFHDKANSKKEPVRIWTRPIL